MTDDIETLKRSLRESWASEKRLAAERDQLRAQMAWLEAHVFDIAFDIAMKLYPTPAPQPGEQNV